MSYLNKINYLFLNFLLFKILFDLFLNLLALPLLKRSDVSYNLLSKVFFNKLLNLGVPGTRFFDDLNLFPTEDFFVFFLDLDEIFFERKS